MSFSFWKEYLGGLEHSSYGGKTEECSNFSVSDLTWRRYLPRMAIVLSARAHLLLLLLFRQAQSLQWDYSVVQDTGMSTSLFHVCIWADISFCTTADTIWTFYSFIPTLTSCMSGKHCPERDSCDFGRRSRGSRGSLEMDWRQVFSSFTHITHHHKHILNCVLMLILAILLTFTIKLIVLTYTVILTLILVLIFTLILIVWLKICAHTPTDIREIVSATRSAPSTATAASTP